MNWLKDNTFHYTDFEINQLVKAKQDQQLKISLCIPTLNEEETIGKEISVFKSELMERNHLLDEIAVIDSGSDDSTEKIAFDSGADVYKASEILPEYGHYQGKGENLWKSIYQLSGDIIVYVDGDIKNVHSGFVSGLVGPLLQSTDVLFVKAFYDRPIAEFNGLHTSGGGRVTEILIRPLFSLFFPELTSLIQPLSGEYAVRREVLEKISFPIGYSVETSHLIDVYHRWGMQAFAQTDLDSRIHTNQSTKALGRMSFRILQAFLRRMESLEVIDGLPELNMTLRQFIGDKGKYKQIIQDIYEVERPPMVEIDAYCKKFLS